MKLNVAVIALRLVDFLVNGVIVIVFGLLFICGLYRIIDSEFAYHQADNAVSYDCPGMRPKRGKRLSFDQLRRMNHDVFGWLEVDGTNISYPLVQGSDNVRYVNTDVKGGFSLIGSIFLDCRNSRDFSDASSIIYGHHMNRHRMFGSLECFEGRKYFERHRTGWLFYDKRWHRVHFFAFVKADAHDSVLFNPYLEKGRKAESGYLKYVRRHACRYRKIRGGREGHFVTLATCSEKSTNGRYLLIGRIEREGSISSRRRMEMVDEQD